MSRRRLTVVYGGGGPYGINFGLGIAHVLQEAGVPLGAADAVGTSAGSWVASALALGVDAATLHDLPPIRVPSLRPGYLRSLAVEVFGEQLVPSVKAVVCKVPVGTRFLLDGALHPAAELVAASSAIPGVFMPVRRGGYALVDGGVRSMASADLAPEADHLLVVAPFAGRSMGRTALLAERQLRFEMYLWTRRYGGTAHLVTPDPEVAALVPSTRDIFDSTLGVPVYEAARVQGERLLAERPELSVLTSLAA